MKKSAFKRIIGIILTVIIALQVVLCVTLMLRTAAGKDAEIFGFRFYYIATPSMEPEIPVGSQIVVKKTDVELLVKGDVITFASRDPAIMGYPNTHRIEAVTEDGDGKLCFVTKGDNNPQVDEYLVYPSEIYGKVVAVAPVYEGIIRFYSFAATPIGFSVVIVMPLLLVLAMFLRSFTKEFKGLAETSAMEKNEEENIDTLIAEYISRHPDEELTPDSTARIAAELMKEMEEIKRKGAEE